MVTTISVLPGVILRCYPDQRFHQGFLSIQFLRYMNREEAAMNALLPAVLLRGCRETPDMRAVIQRLDDLYGAGVNALVRRVGDYQTVGLYGSFIEDRFALPGDRVLEPMLDFLGQLLLEPVTEEGIFCREFVESEKRNLIATLQTERNDKRAYAAAQMLRKMCAADTFGIPRLGEEEQVAAITAQGLWEHYDRVLRESPVEVFYVGSADAETVAQKVAQMFAHLHRDVKRLPAQLPFQDGGGGAYTETMAINQGKLSMGFVTPITNRAPEFAAMQVLNTLFGAGMTSKLFMNVREKMSLCYHIGSGYYGSKGIVTVSAGIDCDKETVVREEILNQLQQCKLGNITAEELGAAKEAVLSALRGAYDSPINIEGVLSVRAISGIEMTLEQYYDAVERVTLEDVTAAAATLHLHTSYFLKGVEM